MVRYTLSFNLRSSFHGRRLELEAAAAKHLHVTNDRQLHDEVTSTVPGPTHVHDLVRYVGMVNGLRVQRLSMLPASAHSP